MKKWLLAAGLSLSVGTAHAQTSVLPYPLPSWDQTQPVQQRFLLVLNGEAVLDKETGLVWQRIPDAEGYHWLDAVYNCRKEATGGRRSWRLPSYEELSSLLDPAQRNPALPPGHPFQGIGAQDVFWTTTQDEGLPTAAWVVQIGLPDTWLTAYKAQPNYFFRPWCVRTGVSTTNAVQ